MTPEQTKRFKYWQTRTIVATMIGYALFYFVRKNFSLAMPGLEADLGISKTSLGIFLTLNGVVYGLSRFVNGILADRMNARWYMAVGLALCALANFAFGFGEDVSYWITGQHDGSQFTNTMILFMGIMWVINGLLQGTGFPPCARLLTHWIPPTQLATKMSVWNTSHSIGAGLVVILCGYIMGTLGMNVSADPDAVAAMAATASGSAETFMPSVPMIYPQRITTRPAPIECEVFHTDIFVASCVGGIQWVSRRAQGGNPVPCSRPFITHMIPMKRIIVLVNCEPSCWPVIQ